MFSFAFLALMQAPATTVVVPAERLVEAATVRLQQHANGIAADWEFLHVGEVAASRVGGGDVPWVEAGTIDGRWPRSRVGVPVNIRIGGRVAQTRMLWFTVRAWREALVYARDQQAGDLSSGVVVQRGRVDVAAIGKATMPVDGAGIAAGQRLLRSVRAGQPVLAEDFGPVPAVARNASVALRVRHGAVALSTGAVARHDAAIGERVSVLPSGATKWIDATVTAQGEVTIEK